MSEGPEAGLTLLDEVAARQPVHPRLLAVPNCWDGSGAMTSPETSIATPPDSPRIVSNATGCLRSPRGPL
jgi:hypothetical protein